MSTATHGSVWGSRWCALIGMVVGGVISSLGASASFAVDVPIEDEADYARLVDAIRATEYTRQGYLETNANPRMIAGLSGLWAFAERNPLATPAQLTAFVTGFDAALSQVVDGDARLEGTGSMVRGLSVVRVGDDSALDGMDTRVGDRALELLGVAIPGLESYGQSQQRMARFDLASNLRWIHQSEVADLMTGVFAGVDPSGRSVAGLVDAAESYVEMLGYAPMVGEIDAARVAVNAGLDGLPTYSEFVLIRDDAGAHAGLEAEVFAGIDSIQVEAESMLVEIGDAVVPSGLSVDSVDLFVAAGDVGHPDHAEAVAFLEARQQAILDSYRATADERASIFARTILLQQSSYPDVVYAADRARSFAGMQLQVNTELAIARESIGIASSIGGLGAAYLSGNLIDGASSLAGVVSGVFAVADLLGDGPASVDDQIFEHISGLRQQVEDLRVQMNDRFDLVDAKLDVIFATMVSSFDLIQDGIETLIADIASVRSALDRIEEALYGFAQNVLLVDLTVLTDEVLDYRNKTGFDLAYTDQSPSYVEAASGLTTFATFTSQTSAFAGVEDNQALTLTIDNAGELLSGDAAVARLINEFRRVPTGLVTSEGDPVNGPLSSGRTPAPAPWSQSAASYTQLAKESPWYFAYLLQTQQNSGGSNPPQIDQIIGQGERIVNLSLATRERDDLFNALIQRASDDSGLIGSLLLERLDDKLVELGLSDGETSVDAWGGVVQTASPVVPHVTGFGGAGAALEVSSAGFAHRGYEIFFADSRTGDGASMSRAELAEGLAMFRASIPSQGLGRSVQVSPNGGGEFTVRIRATGPSTLAERTIRFRLEYLDNGRWLRYTQNQPTSFYQQRLQTLWLPMSQHLDEGNLVGDIYQSGGVRLGCCTTVMSRVRVIQDRSSVPSGVIAYQHGNIESGLATARESIRAQLLLDLEDPEGEFIAPSERLADTRALLDGYVTIANGVALGQSEILRAALRGDPIAGGMWLDAPSWYSVLAEAAIAEDGTLGGPDVVDVPTIGAHFEKRLSALSMELDLATESTSASFPYVEYVLGELRDLRDHAFALSVDDTYLTSGTLTVDSGSGLMSNDVGQEGRIDNEDLMVDLEFMGSPEYVAPAHGSVSVFEDGSFEYIPDPGFEGVDSFSYRLIAEVGDPANPVGDPDVVSSPSMVVVRVELSGCAADITGDGALNFFDVSGFLAAYQQRDSVGDFTGDGLFNFFDVSAFLVAYGEGCP